MRFSKKAIIGWMGGILLISLGCTLQALRVNTSSQELRGTQWELESIGNHGSGAPAQEGARLVMAFPGEGLVGGTDGCNTFEGEYEARFGRLLFHNLSGTRVDCANHTLLERELEYLQALRSSAHYELIDNRLIIWYGEAGETLIFTRSQPPGLVGGIPDKG